MATIRVDIVSAEDRFAFCQAFFEEFLVHLFVLVQIMKVELMMSESVQVVDAPGVNYLRDPHVRN